MFDRKTILNLTSFKAKPLEISNPRGRRMRCTIGLRCLETSELFVDSTPRPRAVFKDVDSGRLADATLVLAPEGHASKISFLEQTHGSIKPRSIKIAKCRPETLKLKHVKEKPTVGDFKISMEIEDSTALFFLHNLGHDLEVEISKPLIQQLKIPGAEDRKPANVVDIGSANGGGGKAKKPASKAARAAKKPPSKPSE